MQLFDLLASNSTALIVACSIFGLFVGSFLNVVIHRVPVMLNREWHDAALEILTEQAVSVDAKPKAEQSKYNIVVPRSACPKCGHKISALENIPVISYLLLKGKCKGCKTPISIRYPSIELLTALCFGLIAYSFGYGLLTLSLLVFTGLLICLTFIDIDTKLLPDNLVYPLLWLGLIVNSFGLITDLQSAVYGALWGYLSLWSIFWLFKLTTGKEGMGYGDFKLLAALGAWLGWQKLLLIVILSSVAGAILGIIILMLSKKDKDTTLPFGPYLAIAGFITLIWGNDLLGSYLKSIGM
jgi:leader peptidase (prepilin peptidase) / N-methyltransferase